MQALLEPFSQAYYFGRERVSSRYLTSEVQPGATFNDIKALCELSYPGQSVLVRERSALATLIVASRVCLSVILSVCPQLRS